MKLCNSSSRINSLLFRVRVREGERGWKPVGSAEGGHAHSEGSRKVSLVGVERFQVVFVFYVRPVSVQNYFVGASVVV